MDLQSSDDGQWPSPKAGAKAAAVVNATVILQYFGENMSDLDWFFRKSCSVPGSNETFSQLYLLRRDIDTCFGVDPNTGKCIAYAAIWPGTMAILAGIDFLGKFLAGTDKTRGPKSASVVQRFTGFATRYLGLTGADARVVYQLRNSLLHSFGLYSEDTGKKGSVTTYNFVLARGAGVLVKDLGNDFYRVDVQILRKLFEQAVAKYEADLRNTSRSDYRELTDRFEAMFPKHAKPMTVS